MILRCFKERGFPLNFSIRRNRRCPPSKAGMGKRLSNARFTDNKVVKDIRDKIPCRAVSPAICAIKIGPPISLMERVPVTKPYRNFKISEQKVKVMLKAAAKD